ncbi:HlyD family efflux transporter periplasmic adaptor subunit [bacterium]|nr:HlyD family efflux transporter periplasmic adaptor subunit [bacterium]MBU1990374.1 HlyD family efflux transporter periplasmic adaptor subunit [bacterium]
MATVEANYMRRAHRVDIPIIIVIDSVAYKSKDWSMTGAGVENFSKELQKDEIIPASIVLALKEAKIEMPIKLQFKLKRGTLSGFEFAEISQKNKRVLREFLELSIEGKLENIDGLLSIYNEPIVDTPIKESVVLSDEEESVLKKEFAKRSKLYIKLGIILFIVLILTIYYNTAFVYRSIGTVSGNFVKISPSVSGKINKINVHTRDKVNQKTLLFELDDKMILNQIDIIDEKLADLNSRYKNVTTTFSPDTQVLNILKKDMDRSYKAFSSANKLYERRIISSIDLDRVSADYLKAKVKYLQEKSNLERKNIAQGSESNIISLKTELELRREELINKLNYLRVFSETNGIVYAIKSHIGNYVGSSDEVMVIETDEPSFVVCKLKQEESVNIRNGMSVKVYSASKDKTFDAHIETIGNLSLNTESEITNEVSLKEVTIKVVFDDDNIRLPLNERVKLWFYKPLV